jgi:hypothetical protein
VTNPGEHLKDVHEGEAESEIIVVYRGPTFSGSRKERPAAKTTYT